MKAAGFNFTTMSPVFVLVIEMMILSVFGEDDKDRFLKFGISPIEEDPEIIGRVRKMSDCTDSELDLIHNKCSSLIRDLIHLTYEYENGLVNNNKCQREQIACFSHPLWINASICACSICNHIWFYNQEMHQHFISYFNDHKCNGNLPKSIDDMQFCQFMNQTERNILPISCKQQQQQEGEKKEEEEEQQQEEKLNDNSNNSNNSFYTNNILIMIWTVIFGVTMSLSLYFYFN